MTTAFIRLIATNALDWKALADSWSDLGLSPELYFEPAGSKRPGIDAGGDVVRVDARLEFEGAGYYINRCVEIAAEVAPKVDRFLVLGDFSDRCSGYRRESFPTFGGKCRVILGTDVESAQTTTKSELLNAFSRGRSALSAGTDGFLLFDRAGWLKQRGFPEDVGSWGVELHFALGALATGDEVSLLPALVTGPFSAEAQDSRVSSGMVAYAEYGGGLLGSLRLVLSALSLSAPLSSLQKGFSDVQSAREALRSRAFFRSGR